MIGFCAGTGPAAILVSWFVRRESIVAPDRPRPVVCTDATELRLETPLRSDGEYIAGALGGALSLSPRGWVVTLEVESSTDLGRFVAALQTCFGQPAVRVALDADSYVMDGA
jgi:hypothetical protein